MIPLCLCLASCSLSVYDFKNDRENQRRIADAYIKYKNIHREYPDSLQDLVHGGLLPKEGEFYKNVIDFSGSRCEYNESDYRLNPPTRANLSKRRLIKYSQPNRAGIDHDNMQFMADIFPVVDVP